MGRVPVVRNLHGGSLAAHQLRVLLQDRREARMQPGMLSRQQVIMDHFPQQGVPEGIPRLVRSYDRSVDRLTQLAFQLPIRGFRSRRQ